MIEETHDILVEKVRIGIGKKSTPSVGIIDSQSVKACNLCEGDVIYDGVKKTKGRKQHIVVDTLGLVMIIVIHAANIHDSFGAKEIMKSLKDKYLTSILKIFADGGYLGQLIEWVRIQNVYGWTLEIVKRNETHTFNVLPRRWTVERTLPRFLFIEEYPKTMKDYPNLVSLLSIYP